MAVKKVAAGTSKLQQTMDEIEKTFGAGSIKLMGDDGILPVEAISTGIFPLDMALGIGGIPRGRIIQAKGPLSSGKSTVALHCVAEAQRQGFVCAYLDLEYALDPAYMRALGVDVDKLLFAQPETAEHTLEIVNRLAASGEVALIVVDSVSALVPRAELEGDMGDANVGLLARLMSQALRKIVASAGKTGTTVLFINQIREKIGVIYGCLSSHTVVPFTDGTSATMKEVVEGRMEQSVWAVDPKTHEVVAAPITNWFHNGQAASHEAFLHVSTGSIGTLNGRQGGWFTKNHKILTKDDGWVAACDLSPGEHSVVTHYPSRLNGSYASFVYGCVIGDSHIKGKSATGALVLANTENEEYQEWKLNLLQPVIGDIKKTTSTNHGKEYCCYSTSFSVDLGLLRSEIGGAGCKYPSGVMKKSEFDDLSMAIWYMDDGSLSHNKCATISAKRLKNNVDEWDSILRHMWSMGFEAQAYLSQGLLHISKESSPMFFTRISKFVPPSMQYKLPPEFREKYEDFSLDCCDEERTHYVPVIDVQLAAKHAGRDLYDIEVGGYSNYMVGSNRAGFVVHNSNETVSGGRALGFYASVDMDVRKGEPIKDSENQIIGYRTKVKMVKNKVGPAYRVAEFDIIFGQGAPKANSLYDMAIETGVLTTSSGWVYLDGENFANGKAKSKERLANEPETYALIKKYVDEKLNPIEVEEIE